MKTYKCKVCGLIFDVADGVEPVCPKCKMKDDKLELIEAPAKTTKYAGTHKRPAYFCKLFMRKVLQPTGILRFRSALTD